MIPFKSTYSKDIINEFEYIFEDLAYHIREISKNKWRDQIDLRLDKKIIGYNESIKNFLNPILDNFNHSCVYCFRHSNLEIIPIHPLEKNLEFPELCQKIDNIYVVCINCRSKINVEYEKKRLPLNKKINLFDLIKKYPNIIMPTFEPTQKYISFKLKEEMNNIKQNQHRIYTQDFLILMNEQGFEKLLPQRLQFTIELLRLDYIINFLQVSVRAYLDDEYAEGFEFLYYKKFWDTFRAKNSNGLNRTVNIQIDYAFASNLSINNKLMRFSSQLPEIYIEESIYDRLDKKFHSIEIKNIRCFDSLSLDISERSSLFILGDNGTGKTTLLELFSILDSKNSKEVIRKAEDEFLFNKNIDGNFLVEWQSLNSDYHLSEISISPSRRASNKYPTHINSIDVCYVKTSRTDKVFLNTLNELLQENDLLNEFSKMFRHLLDLSDDEGFINRDGEVFLLDELGGEYRLSTVSSGVNSIFKILYSIYKKFPNYKRGRLPKGYYYGCVLIDELELHLHPRWKNNIAKKLMEIYPDLFFIVTTHDPLIIKGVNNKDVIVVKRAFKAEKSTVLPHLPNTEGYGTDLILTSPYFGLTDLYEEKDQIKSQMSYREQLTRQVIKESLELNLNFSSNELAILVANTFAESLDEEA